MFKYSAVIPSKDIKSVVFTTNNLITNSCYLDEILIYWNGDPMDRMAVNTELAKNSIFNKRGVVIQVIPASGVEVYTMFNQGVIEAKNEFVLLINDDMYCPPDWDKYFTELWKDPIALHRGVVTFQLVESGFVPVNEINIHKDFVKTIEEFRVGEFDEYASKYGRDIIGSGLGWFMPVLFPRQLFIENGCYPTLPPFPYPNDRVFFDKLKQTIGVEFWKVNSPIYHFQRLSQRVDIKTSDKLNLCCGDDKREGYINADFKDADINFDLSGGVIPLESNRFSEVIFRHALEHFRPEIGSAILVEIYRILKDKGVLYVNVPDFEMALKDYLLGYNQHPDCAPAMNRIYGLSTSEQQIHKWGYTGESLGELLVAIGFSNIQQIDTPIIDEISIKAIK